MSDERPAENGGQWNTGYYSLSSKTGTLKAFDLRAYGQLALQLWADGEMVEDNTDGYLLTSASTMIGTPVALHRLQVRRLSSQPP